MMVYPAFANLEVEFWLHRGRLGITEPSLCLFHSSVADGTPILDALRELSEESCPAQRALTFAPNSRECQLKKLTVRLTARRDDLKIMHIGHETDVAFIETTPEGLQLLIDALETWLAGAEDFGVSPRLSGLSSKNLGELDRKSGELWFWGPDYVAP